MKEVTTVLALALVTSCATHPAATSRHHLPPATADDLAPSVAALRGGDAVRQDTFLGIQQHRVNYIGHSQNFSRDRATMPPNYADNETTFQLSIRRDLSRIHEDKRLAFAYTGRSFWQTAASSAPFRTTDHEPELFYEHDYTSHPTDNNITLRAGVVHQSNGEDGASSRSWDRVYGELIAHSPKWFDDTVVPSEPAWYLSVKPWWIIGKGNGNRDIDEYMGYFEVAGAYAWGQPKYRPRVSARFRHNGRTESPRGSVEVEFSIASRFAEGLRVFVQYFNGYGENLLDYADSSNRVTVGIELSRAR